MFSFCLACLLCSLPLFTTTTTTSLFIWCCCCKKIIFIFALSTRSINLMPQREFNKRKAHIQTHTTQSHTQAYLQLYTLMPEAHTHLYTQIHANTRFTFTLKIVVTSLAAVVDILHYYKRGNSNNSNGNASRIFYNCKLSHLTVVLAVAVAVVMHLTTHVNSDSSNSNYISNYNSNNNGNSGRAWSFINTGKRFFFSLFFIYLPGTTFAYRAPLAPRPRLPLFTPVTWPPLLLLICCCHCCSCCCCCCRTHVLFFFLHCRHFFPFRFFVVILLFSTSI